MSKSSSNKWEKSKGKQFKPAKEPPSGVSTAKEVISSGYEDYLLLLQERNRLLKRLKEKDVKQIELEKKEQGFSIYVNGANVELGKVVPHPPTSKSRSQSRQTKTADAYSERKRQLEYELQWLEREIGETRAKTAPIPDPLPRKGWQPDAVHIKTSKGAKVKVCAPGLLSGKYSEDFEAMENDDASDDDNDFEEDLERYLNSSEDIDLEDDGEDDDDDELTLSINDVETLRKSLEADESIRESIKAAQEQIEWEEKSNAGTKEEEEEEEEEIEEELEGANSSLNLAEIDKLPHLMQANKAPPGKRECIEPKEKIEKMESKKSIGTEYVTNNVTPILKEKTFVKESPGKKNERKGKKRNERNETDEDLVVLSFSNRSNAKNKERVLSGARRKSDAEDFIPVVNTVKDKASSLTMFIPLNSKTQEDNMEMNSSPRIKSRRLSSTRKSQSFEQMEVDKDAEEIFKAMALENQTIGTSSGFHTAPEKRRAEQAGAASDKTPRPASMGSNPGETISRVTQKVRNMDARQQQHLISLLSKLELKGPPFKSSSPIKAKQSASPMKATVPYTTITQQQSYSQEPVETKSSLVSQQVESTDESLFNQCEDLEVTIEIQSNWGHPNTLGVTEIQFLDFEGKILHYNTDDITVSGYLGDQGMLSNLSNGKTKTNKSKYMWYCQFLSGSCVELMFHLSINLRNLAKIVIWNFNGGVKDLNMGVKDVRVFIGGELLWTGTIDKGCGNQVFDYSTVINLSEPLKKSENVEPVIRSKTVVLHRSTDATQDNPRNLPAVISTKTETDTYQAMTDKNTPRKRGDNITEKEVDNLLHSGKPEVDTDLTSSRTPTQQSPIPILSKKPSAQSPQNSPVMEQKMASPQHTCKSFSPAKQIEKSKAAGLESLLWSKQIEGRQGNKVTRWNSTPNLSSDFDSNKDTSIDALRGDSAALPSKPPWIEESRMKAQSRSSSRPKSRPIWLQNNEDSCLQSPKRSLSSTEVRFDHIPSPLEGTFRSRSSGDRSNSLPGKNDSILNDQWPENFASKQEESLPTFLEPALLQKERRKSDSRHSRRRDQSPSPLATPTDHVMPARPDHVMSARSDHVETHPSCSQEENPQHDPLSRRRQWRMDQSLSLEESWNVLSMFERSHKGRITKDMDLDCHDDALDQFLSSDVNRPGSRVEIPRDPQEYTQVDGSYVTTSQEIPTLPKGKRLTIVIKSTWGDRHYVGLNGIEVFTEYGKPAEIQQISAEPPDINVLPEYGSDPRVVSNLIDGIYRTRDDMHLWMAPFTPDSNHYIYMTFTDNIKIAMIRIWNYNKSRIHSYRGARDVEIFLDDNVVFQGEIQRASGTLGEDEPFGDTILFTMDEEILNAMSFYDQTYEIPEEEESLMYSKEYERPSTADKDDDSEDSGDRPFTCARRRQKMNPEGETADQEIDLAVESDAEGFVYGQVLELCFVATWGDPYYLGLTGLELFGPTMETIPLAIDMLDANPRDLNDLPNYGDDDRTLDKIIDGTNVTTSDEHMWLIPYTEGNDHTLTINIDYVTQLLGMRVWNYNKSADDTFRGAKLVHVKLDGRILSPSEGYLLRKGPGNTHFDFAQDIYFVKSAAPSLGHVTSGDADEPIRRPESRVNIKKLVPDYEPTLMPTGFVFQFHLLSSWGDPYYLGLNGIEFYDENGYRVHLTANNVTAYPHSVNVLDGVTDDVRTPDKLIDGANDTNDGRHMWLAPIFPGQVNLIYVIFDEPVTVSMVKMWNYSKTPIRGVQQFGIFVDDLLVYHGFLPQVPTRRGILPTVDMPVPHHTVLFTDREQIAMSERKNVVRSNDLEQDVQLTNDKRVVTRYADPKSAGKAADPALRPMTSVKSLSKYPR